MNQADIALSEPFIPHDVALMVVRGNMSLVKAWRLRLNLSVDEIAAAAGMRPEEVARIEARENGFSRSLLNLASVMNLDIEQLVDITN